MKPYGIVSDVHLNDWNMFATVDKFGRNTRLMGTISELNRGCNTLLEKGGETMICAGDWFHKRGSVSPEVFNPVRDFITKSVQQGIKWRGITGNHDLASRESVELQSSVAMLNGIEGFEFSHGVTFIEECGVVLFPWIDNPVKYREAIAKWAEENPGIASKSDLICHVGIDGTLRNMPDHGVSVEFFKKLPFKRVFSGHYHQHKDFGDGVYSIGATTHQTWGDVGTKAGFLIVEERTVKFHASHQPRFVVIDSDTPEEDIALEADGNYVQMKIGSATNKQIQEARKLLQDKGAKGVSIVASAAKTTERLTSVSSLSSIDDSVSEYCKTNDMTDIAPDCIAILKGVRA